MSAVQARWVLQLDDGTTIARSAARRAPLVSPTEIETALATAARKPPVTSRCAQSCKVVFGLDATGRLVVTYLPKDRSGRVHTAGLVGELRAAVAWLSGAPRAHWRRVRVTTPEAAQ